MCDYENYKPLECKACGYRIGYDREEDNDDKKLPIRIDGNFTIEEWSKKIERVNLFACPECNSVIMKLIKK